MVLFCEERLELDKKDTGGCVFLGFEGKMKYLLLLLFEVGVNLFHVLIVRCIVLMVIV